MRDLLERLEEGLKETDPDWSFAKAFKTEVKPVLSKKMTYKGVLVGNHMFSDPGGGIVSIFEAGTGWVAGIERVGIIAGVLGKPEKPSEKKANEAAFDFAVDVLKRAGMKVKGTSRYSKMIDFT